MHDAHPVYRVEIGPHWNLKPNGGQVIPSLNPPRDAAYVPPTTNDLVLAEQVGERCCLEGKHQPEKVARELFHERQNQLPALVPRHSADEEVSYGGSRGSLFLRE